MMASQTDVLSTRLAASGDVTVSARARLRGVWLVPGTTAGSVAFKDGGSSGTTLLTLDTPANATSAVPIYILLPGEGQLFRTSIYATVTNTAFVTAFWS